MIKTNTLELEELNIYKNCNEAQLLHYNEPAPGIFIAESPKVIERALNAGFEPISMLLEEGHVQSEASEITSRIEKEYNIPIYLAAPNILSGLTGYELTRGAVCAMKRKPLISAYDLCRSADRIAVLENVVNPTNIGTIVRNAAALGLDAILFTKGCADPLYRRALRVSMGTAVQIPWTFIDIHENINSATIKKDGSMSIGQSDDIDTVSYVSCLKSWGFTTIAMALKDNSYNINDPYLYKNKKTAIILGTEGDGLSEETIAESDFTVCIPMKHGVDSLNVASASAIAFWSLMTY